MRAELQEARAEAVAAAAEHAKTAAALRLQLDEFASAANLMAATAGGRGAAVGDDGAVPHPNQPAARTWFRRAELSTLFFEGKNTVVYSNSSPLGGGGETGDECGALPNLL